MRNRAAFSRAIVGAGLVALLVLGASPAMAEAGTSAQPWTHADCVGPGLPGTAPLPTTYTETVTGFVFNGAPITFSLVTFGPFGAGICPTAVSGPVLAQDYTGTYHFMARCGAGTANPGAVFLDAELRVVAGVIPVGSGFGGVSCQGPLNGSFALDITITQGPVSAFGVTLPPTGGTQAQLSQ